MGFSSFFQGMSRSEPSGLSSFSLMDLILREDWKLAEMEIRESPGEVKQWVHQEGFFDGEHASNVLPIHQACALRPTKEMIESLYDAYPESISACETTFKRSPLHIACQTGATLEIIQTLLDLYSDAARIKDTLGRLPIHYACSHGASEQIVAALLKAFGGSAACSDKNGWLPLVSNFRADSMFWYLFCHLIFSNCWLFLFSMLRAALATTMV